VSERDLFAEPRDGATVEPGTPQPNGGEAGARFFIHAVELENIFCYARETVAFERGVSVFAGSNGSGKSSLLEAVFFAFFGSGARSVTGRELGEVLREGERAGSVSLDFSFGPHRYRAHMALRRSGEKVSADGQHCWLKRDDDAQWTGVRDVTEQLQGLIHMDSEDFANCLYVRQGEVDRLIKARKEERQSTIDRLLRLDTLDDYARRAREGVQRALNRRTGRVEGGLEAVERELEGLDGEALGQKGAELKRALAALEGKQAKAEEQRAAYEDRIRELQAQRAQFDRSAQELEKGRARVAELERELGERDKQERALRAQERALEADLAERKRALGACSGEPPWAELGLDEADPGAVLEALDARIEEMDEALARERDKLTERRTELRTLASNREQLARRKADREQKLEEAREALAPLQAQLEAQLAPLERPRADETLAQVDLDADRAELAEARDDKRDSLSLLRERKAALAAELEQTEAEQGRAEALVEAGRCPTCQQAVSAETLADQLGHLREQLETKRAQLERTEGALRSEQEELDRLDARLRAVEAAARALADYRERSRGAEALGTELEEIDGELESLDARADELKEEEQTTHAAGSALKAKREALGEQRAFVDQVKTLRAEVEAYAERVESRRQMHQEFLTNSDARRQELSALEERLRALDEQLGERDLDGLKREISELQGQHEGWRTHLQALQSKRDDLQQKLGDLKRAQQRLEQLKAQKKEQTTRIERLKSLQAEIERLQQLYAEVKLNQRQRNLQALNAVFNHFFRLMYFGPAYERVELSEDFDIRVIRKDGQVLSPAIMSGGERALINLALRAAIHQVLSEAGGVALPLFFDEPTVYLDTQHVRQLERLFEDLGQRVGQVVIVSHEASLVEGADHEYRVSKDIDNLGHIEKVR